MACNRGSPSGPTGLRRLCRFCERSPASKYSGASSSCSRGPCRVCSRNVMHEPRPSQNPIRTALRHAATIGSGLLILLGVATVGIGALLSDTPGFFVLSGLSLSAAGGTGIAHHLVRARGWYRLLLRVMSIVLNALIVLWLTKFIVGGTVRGSLAAAAPVLLGLPAVLNIVAAILNLGRQRAAGVCPHCRCDPRGLRTPPCPECCAAITSPTTPHPPRQIA